MSSSSSSLFSLLFIAIFLVSFSQIALSLSSKYFLTSHNDDINPKKFQEKLIRQLNLFPKHDINIVTNYDDDKKLFEKKLNLSFLGDSGSTLQDLAHHAGYFPLVHTKDARFDFYFQCHHLFLSVQCWSNNKILFASPTIIFSLSYIR